MPKLTEQNNINAQTGLVVSYFGNSVAVEAPNGQVFQCYLKRNQELPVVGDKVLWQLEKGDTGFILEIEPRFSLLSRGDGHTKTKPLAANIDAILIVMAPPPIFSEYLIDRYLVAAELLKIEPVIILNKSDLLDDSSKAEALERLKVYQAVPYQTILSSALTVDGLKGFSEVLQNKTAVLVGPSGVGKSSIIAALNSDKTIKIGDVTQKGAGKHTTTATRLHHLLHGGNLIDSPGVREFNLWSVSKSEIWQAYKEFHPYAKDCKFRDCQHIAEPGCSVQKAIADGKISAQRFTSYQELMKKSASK